MIVAIIGSRSLSVDSFEKYVGGDDVIISGGADGIDQCAVSYAIKNGIAYEEILPDYKKASTYNRYADRSLWRYRQRV